MSLSTYSDISSALVKWLNREGFSSLTDQVADLIAIGQRRIHRDCDLNAMEEVVSLTIDSQAVDTPAGFKRTKSITIQQDNNTFEVTGSSHQAVMSYTTNERPTRFSVIGNKFYFGPPPDQTYTAQLVYFKSLPILSPGNTTNWISENEPEFLIYAAMVEACLFLKDDARAQLWEARYNAIKDSIMQSEERMDKPYGSIGVRNL